MTSTSGSITQVVPLGLNGFYPSHGRQTMCFLVEVSTPTGRVGLLLDAGTGVGRLAESGCPVPLDRLVRFEVLLTHYHLDHVSGLAALPAALRTAGATAPLRLWAPTRPLVDAEPLQDLHRLIGPPLFPHRLDAFRPAIEIRPYGDAADLDELAKELGLTIRARRNTHPGGAVGLRFGDQLAYVTDSAPDAAGLDDGGTAALVRGVHTLMHEVWATAAEARVDPQLLQGHCDTQAVLDLARRAGIERLVPVHHPPQRDDRALEELHGGLDHASFRLHRPREAAAIRFDSTDTSPGDRSPATRPTPGPP